MRFMKHPTIILKVAMSLDGCINDTSEQRRIFSSAEDQQKVDELRASCDAILVGAQTIRADNPRLSIRSGRLRRYRQQHGLPADILKVTLTRSGELDPAAQFFQWGKLEKLVYVPREKAEDLARRLAGLATIIPCRGTDVDLEFLLDDLFEKGVRRLLVEGGSSVITAFLASPWLSQLRLAVAPVFVGNPSAPQLVTKQLSFPPQRIPVLHAVEKLGDMSVLTYVWN